MVSAGGVGGVDWGGLLTARECNWTGTISCEQQKPKDFCWGMSGGIGSLESSFGRSPSHQKTIGGNLTYL